MSTNVGSVGISLDLEVSSRLEKQIGTISENIAANLKTNIEKSVQKTDLSKPLGKTFASITKKSMDVGSKIGKNLIDGIKNATKKASESVNTVKPVEATSNPVKSFKGISKDDLIIKRDNSIAMQENINAQIESLRAKLKQLQNINVDGSLSDDLLKIESRMISLTDKSDRLTVDIRQLDSAIDGFDTEEVTKQTSKASKSIEKMSNSVKRSQRPLINMRSIGASLARNFLGLQLLITLVGQAVRKMAQAFWNSLKTNEEFKKSLSQIKGNLATAFQPIFQAIMPAINALMRGLAKATAYLAAFTSLLFGKSVKAMNASAKAMANANKEASKMVAGFDQLNDITESGDKGESAISPVNIDEAEVSKIQSVMNKIKSVFESAFGGIINQIATRSSELFNKILPSLQITVENIKTLFTTVFTDIQNAAGKFFPKLIEQYQIYIDNLFKTFGPAIEFIVSVWEDMSKILLDVWNKYGKDILNSVGEFIVGIMDTFNKIWTHIIDPIIRPAVEMLKKLWDEHLKDLVIKIADFVGYVILESLRFYNKFIKPIVDWLVITLGPIFAWVFDNIFKTVGTIFGKIFDKISSTITKLKGIFNGLLTFLEGVFTGNWSKIFEGLGQIIKNIFGGLGEIILNPFRSIRENINNLIRSANKIKMPSWLGGASINIPEIPKFASGGVLKQPTLNIAGEYPGASSNPEIVTPQNIMAETFREVMREFMNEFRQTGNMSSQAVNLIVNIGGKKMLEQLIKLVEDYEKQTGKEFNFNV